VANGWDFSIEYTFHQGVTDLFMFSIQKFSCIGKGYSECRNTADGPEAHCHKPEE